MYPLFESIKVVDGHFFNLEWHQQRVDQSRQQLDLAGEAMNLASCLEVPEAHSRGIVKCRVSYGKALGPVDYTSYHKKNVNSLQQIECEPFDYRFKYQDRSILDQLFQLRGTCDDVLITIHGLLTDTSYSNVVLFDGTSWYTPETPLLPGTQRAKLLATGEIQAARIQTSELGDFKRLTLINAMLDFDPNHSLSISDIKLWHRDRYSF